MMHRRQDRNTAYPIAATLITTATTRGIILLDFSVEVANYYSEINLFNFKVGKYLKKNLFRGKKTRLFFYGASRRG